jgi:4'-phosphopantetheinyl transferase
MPIYKAFNCEGLCYIMWKIEENEEELRNSAILSEEEVLEYSKISNKNRRLQWLAARVAIKTAIEDREEVYYGIKKTSTNKPHLINANIAVSISHCSEYAIAALSTTHDVGIDIQKYTDKLSITKTKFLSSAELCYGDLSIKKLCIMWSAKEAIYKLFSGCISSIKNDILINNFSLNDNGVLSSRCMSKEINVYYESYSDYTICYVIN